MSNQIRRLLVHILAIIGGLYLFVVYTPIANILAMPLLTIASKPTKADVIMVLSGGRYGDGSLNEAALERTITAVRLFQKGLAPRLLFVGGPCCGQSASAAMANLALELGVPRSAILLEEQSHRTAEASYSVTLLRKNGMKTVILVTSPLHMLRASLVYEAAGVAICPVRASEKDLWWVSNAVERISILQQAIHEYLGLAYYRFRGWI